LSHGSGSRIWDPESRIWDPRFRIRDPGSGIRDPGSGIRDPRSRIRDPVSGIQDPGSRMGKKSGSGSGMNNPDHISKSLETILKYSNSFRRIRDGKNSLPGPVMEKSRIRDIHPGSATLEI